MNDRTAYDNYPCWILIVSNLVMIGTYLTGAFIIYQFGIYWMMLYILYIAALQIRLMKKSCVSCYYYGKYCAFGTGKIAPLFFKKGNPSDFVNCSITWKDMIPDVLVTLVPVIGGVVLLILNFNLPVLASLILISFLGTAGNGFVRGNLACKFCRQRELGCPAERFFNKNK